MPWTRRRSSRAGLTAERTDDLSGVEAAKACAEERLIGTLAKASGACTGCNKPSYAKLLTQLYGEKTVNGVSCSLV